MKNLCLKNDEGKVVRLIPVDAVDEILVVRSPSDQRLLFRPSFEQEALEAEGWEILKKFSSEQALKAPIALTPQLSLAACDTDEVIVNSALADEDQSTWKRSAVGTLILGFLLMFGILRMPAPEPQEIEEEMKEQIVKIVKLQQPEPIKIKPTHTTTTTTVSTPTTTAPKVRTTQTIKRMGALAALGNAKSNNGQQGGLDLGAVKTSAGPGLGGGTEGSGGVQTSLYGKGIVSAPVGVGGNLQGAGGYGTKGKGGGQAGYGTLSLVGSAGDSMIPVGEEVITGGGLDHGAIWDVIRRNQGQIRFCYEQGLQSDPNLKGRVITDFTIGGNGQVTTLKIANTTINSKIVEDCISLRIKSWKFPLPEGGKSVSVKVPFNLNRQGRG